jgi:NAD-dependent deacetylase
MTAPDLATSVEQAANAIAGSRYVVALVGAGLSAESGIPTFRGPDGLWTKHGEPDLRDYERFAEDPKTWWEMRIERQGQFGEFVDALNAAVPNAGHLALSDMETGGWLQHIITQNIDNLHRVAGNQNLTEIHGNRTLLRCILCNQRWPLDEFPIDELPPHCPEPCGGIVKGDTVMFGEPIPRDALDSCIEQTRRCDTMLLIGTSAVVYPVAGFPIDVKRSGGTLIEINPNETPLTDMAEIVVRGPSGESLPLIVDALKALAAA